MNLDDIFQNLPYEKFNQNNIDIFLKSNSESKIILNSKISYFENKIKSNSKTFYFASKLLDANIINDVNIIYALNRYLDDIVDEHSDRNKLILIKKLITNSEVSKSDQELDLILHNYYAIKIKYDIDNQFILDQINGQLMDLDKTNISTYDILDKYCYNVSSSVGLILLNIMSDKYLENETIKLGAISLGKAFQLTNISRDLITDYKIKRSYIPDELLEEIGINRTTYIEALANNNDFILKKVASKLIYMADEHYKIAYDSIFLLDSKHQLAIMAALLCYREIGINILKHKCYIQRMTTSIFKKIYLLIFSYIALWFGSIIKALLFNFD
jgi:phytoene synthase